MALWLSHDLLKSGEIMRYNFVYYGVLALSLGLGLCAASCADGNVQSYAENECGGSAVLAHALGSPCGECGTWHCDGIDALSCADQERNACGGCMPMEAQPEQKCGECGTWKCDGAEKITCEGDTKNACGGCAQLHEDVGQTCGDCGKWICAAPDTLVCDGDTPNVCGGCETLEHEPKESCGGCGAYACDGKEQVKCVDAANACGGCGILDGQPKQSCGECKKGVWTCNTEKTAVTCIGDIETNECGGCEVLTNKVNTPCGPCNDGKWACLSNNKNALECVGAREKNTCGGCTEGKVNDPCGVCLSGIYECKNSDLFCSIATNTIASSARHLVGPRVGGAYVDDDPNWYSASGSLKDSSEERWFWAYVTDEANIFDTLNPEVKLIAPQKEHKLCLYFRKDSATNNVVPNYNCVSIPNAAFTKETITVSGNLYAGCCTTTQTTADRYLKLTGFGTAGADTMRLYYQVTSYSPHSKTCEQLKFTMQYKF